MECLKDLPSTDPANFSTVCSSRKPVDHGLGVPKAHRVEGSEDEKKITNDKKPAILQFLEKYYALKKPVEDAAEAKEEPKSRRPVQQASKPQESRKRKRPPS